MIYKKTLIKNIPIDTSIKTKRQNSFFHKLVFDLKNWA